MIIACQYSILRSPHIINTVAPITGGVNGPALDATASTAAAKVGGYPILIMSGIVIVPTVATLAMVLPFTMPKRALPITEALAGPPLNRPVDASARFMNESEAFELRRNEPKITNARIRVAMRCVTFPKIPLDMKY